MSDVVNRTHIRKGFFAISLKPLCLLMFHGQSFFGLFAESPQTPVFTRVSAYRRFLAVFYVSRARIATPEALNHAQNALFFGQNALFLNRCESGT